MCWALAWGGTLNTASGGVKRLRRRAEHRASYILVRAPRPYPGLDLTGGAGAAHRIPLLDGLRGYAVLLVLVYHFAAPFRQSADTAAAFVYRIISFGWTGVDLFFVLSGFLITGILFDAKGSAGYFRTFYMRRALRILPLYYGALAAIFFLPRMVDSPTAERFATPASDQIWYWLYLQNFHIMPGDVAQFTGHLWSLAIEEQFYLVWPVVIFALSRRTALLACGALAVFALGLRVWLVLVVGNHGVTVFSATQTRIGGLVIGAAVALLARGERGLEIPRRLAFATVAITSALLAVVFIQSGYFATASRLQSSFGLSAVAMLYGAVLVLSIERPPRFLAAALGSRSMAFFGRYGYGLYVLHVPVLIVLGSSGVTAERLVRLTGNPVVALVAYVAVLLAATTACAWLSWHFYEKHFMALKSRFDYGRRVAPVAK